MIVKSSRSFVGSSINQWHLTYVLLPAVVPARGHEDVVAAHHLLAHAAAQVEGRAAERLPAS